MRYALRLETAYRYQQPVTFGQHIVRMMLSAQPGQRTLSADLSIDPPPTERDQGRDFFNNPQEWVTLAGSHDHLTLTLTAEVEVNRMDPKTLFPDQPWEEVRAAALAQPSLSPDAPGHFLFPSRRIILDDAMTAYAAESFTEGRPLSAAVSELNTRFFEDFEYKGGVTHAGTMAAEAFTLKQGVCQDYAQAMIGALRGLGLPAAYVSGFLRTEPPPGRERLVGADATHAWVEIWAGSEIGWIGYDPTNGIEVGDDHIILARGRDYADVAPVDGVIVTSGGHTVDVAVDVVPEG